MEPEKYPLTFADAFDADLRSTGMEQSQVCEMLTIEGEPVITTAAISNWKKRDRVPLGRLLRLVEIFGKDSRTAEFLRLAERDGLQRVTPHAPRPRQRAGLMIPFNYMAESLPPEGDDELRKLRKLLQLVPQDKKAAALHAAVNAVLEFID